MQQKDLSKNSGDIFEVNILKINLLTNKGHRHFEARMSSCAEIQNSAG
jgi:hypothetical protein